jgi:hypothetical protein
MVPMPPVTTSSPAVLAVSEDDVNSSAPVVSDLIIGFDKLLIFKDFFMILLDIKNIAYRVPILNSKLP